MNTASGTARRVLLVEDDVDIREALSDLLLEEGYQVSCASDGRQALEQLGSAPVPDVILLDLMMPVMDGWGFRAEQERSALFAHVPVVVLSADSATRQKAMEMGVRFHLRKPIQVDDLLRLLETVCGDPGLERRSPGGS